MTTQIVTVLMLQESPAQCVGCVWDADTLPSSKCEVGVKTARVKIEKVHSLQTLLGERPRSLQTLFLKRTNTLLEIHVTNFCITTL